MKRETAIRNVQRIADTLHETNGLIGTAGTSYDAVRIKRAWVFGSTAKGKENPNDVDILLDISNAGRRYWTNKDKDRGQRWRYGARLDRRARRVFGLIVPMDAEEDAMRRIRDNMKMIRLHRFKHDGNFGDIPQTKVMIYPRNDFAALTSSH